MKGNGEAQAINVASGNAVNTIDQAILSRQCTACGRPEKSSGCMAVVSVRIAIQMLCGVVMGLFVKIRHGVFLWLPGIKI